MDRELAETSPSPTFLQSRDRGAAAAARFSWHRLVAIAARQHDVVSLEQIVSLGITASGVRDLLAAGKLRRIHRGVYALGASPLTRNGHWAAAVLACGRGSLLAGRAAGALQGICPVSGGRIEVVSPCQVRRRHAGIEAHACSNLLPRDRTACDLIPCTSVARTLLQLAASGSEDATARAVEQAEIRRLFDLHQIEDVLERNRGHRGVKRLSAAVRAIGCSGPGSRDVFEARFHALTPRLSLPPPQRNVWIELPGAVWHELDFYWPALGLAVELDGLDTHGTRSGRRKDRSKDRRVAAVGIQVIRFIWEDLDDPSAVIAEVEAVAAQRRRERMNSTASTGSSVSVSSSS